MTGPPASGFRLDELARRAGVATTTVRLYQNKGLLPGPRLLGRTGFYDESHVARLALIGRLQDEGFSLAGIRRLLESWENGLDLAGMVGIEEELDVLLNGRSGLVMSPAELLERFPPGTMTPEQVQRSAAMGLVELLDDGQVRVPDRRFLEAGATLVGLGVPVDVVLDEWAHLIGVTDSVADRFIGVFEHHLLPEGWRGGAEQAATPDTAVTLRKLSETARQVTLAALDASIARAGTRRLGEVFPPERVKGRPPS